MRTTEPFLSPPISGTANAASATADAATAFPGTLSQFTPPAAKEFARHDGSHAPDILRQIGHDPEAIP